MKLDVFGRQMQVLREGDRWSLFLLGADGKKRPVHDIVIPANMNEDQVLVYIADIFHEFASPEKPGVRKL
ncbi:MAG: DUF7661 family protein [Bdellovibrionales bacterium]